MRTRTKLKKAIDNKNLTYAQLGEAVGVSRQMIGYYIKNKYDPSLSKAQAIAEYLDSTVEELFGNLNENVVMQTKKVVSW